MSVAEEAAFHNKAVQFAELAQDEYAKGALTYAAIAAQLSTTYAIMAQTGLLHTYLSELHTAEGGA